MKKLILASVVVALVGCNDSDDSVNPDYPKATPDNPIQNPPTDDGGRMPENPDYDASIDRGIGGNWITKEFAMKAQNRGFTAEEIETLCKPVEGHFIDCVVEDGYAVVKILKPETNLGSDLPTINVRDVDNMTVLNITKPSITWIGAYEYESGVERLVYEKPNHEKARFNYASTEAPELPTQRREMSSSDSLSVKTSYAASLTPFEFSEKDAVVMVETYKSLTTWATPVYVTDGYKSVEITPDEFYTDATSEITDELAEKALILISKGWY